MYLFSDIDKIHDGIGDKFSLLIQWVATFFAGFIFGFVRGWQLALLLVAIAPLLVISATIFSKVKTRNELLHNCIQCEAHLSLSVQYTWSLNTIYSATIENTIAAYSDNNSYILKIFGYIF